MMDVVSESAVLYGIYNEEHVHANIELLSSFDEITDARLSAYLDISEKSLRNYRKDSSKVSLQLKEHLLLLRRLFDLGMNLFSNKSDWVRWLSTPNFLMDNNPPEYYLTTITGIGFVFDRLVGMQYGDNA